MVDDAPGRTRARLPVHGLVCERDVDAHRCDQWNGDASASNAAPWYWHRHHWRDVSMDFSQTIGFVDLLRGPNVYYELIGNPDDRHETLLHRRWLRRTGGWRRFSIASSRTERCRSGSKSPMVAATEASRTRRVARVRRSSVANTAGHSVSRRVERRSECAPRLLCASDE